MEIIGTILFVIYIIAGYWATGETIYANKIIIHKFGELFISRLFFGVMFGFVLIPVAIIKHLICK